MSAAKTPRGRALRWLSTHRGLTESPYGSNADSRADGISHAQRTCAGGAGFLNHAPWCGVWAFMALKAGGVRGLSSRLASVSLIEDDARAHRGPFRGWATGPRGVLRGDLVVLFGRGIHVATVRAIVPRLGIVITDEGNTTSGNAGNQANGGGSFRRVRPLSAVHGFALVNYPGS